MPRIDVATVPARKGSGYPAPFDAPCASRTRKRLGDAGGLKDFGVNLMTLPPGGWSSQRHWHSHEDEFVYMLEGELVLVTDAGEQVVRPGDIVGFKGGVADGHHFVNRSDRDAVYLVVGTRIDADFATYSDIDMKTFARTQLAKVADLSQNVVIYIARNDGALGFANFFSGASRLGRPNVAELGMTREELEQVAQNARFQVIDVSDVPGILSAGHGMRGHGYWYGSDWVITDLVANLVWQIPAADRGLTGPGVHQGVTVLVGLRRPAEQIAVEGSRPIGVGAGDLEERYRTAHDRLLSRRRCPDRSVGHVIR